MRALLSSPPPPFPSSTSPANQRNRNSLLLIISISIAAFLALLALLVFLLISLRRFLRRSPTLPLPSPSPPPLRRFSFSSLRHATSQFHPHLSLGRGASASVFRGLLPDGTSIAVKRLHDSSDDRDFNNELHLLSSLPPSPFVVSLLGYCVEGNRRRRRRRRLLVYEYMPNGSLQEALFGSSETSPAVPLSWERRFSIVLDVARALAFLHLECDPPVVHGDIKPSNVLLGADFTAKISDFGLSRMKTEAEVGPEFFSQDLGPGHDPWKSQDFAFTAGRASNYGRNLNGSPRGKEVGAAASPAQDEILSIEHSKELGAILHFDDARTESSGQWGKDWWWKQEGSGELTSKDYVREWIGSQIGPSSNPDWDDARKNSPELGGSRRVENSDVVDGSFVAVMMDKKNDKKQENKKLGGSGVASQKGEKKMREWWKEEYFAEISNKNGSKKEKNWFRTVSNRARDCTTNALESGSKRHRDLNGDVAFKRGWKKKRSQSFGSDMFSGDLFSRELSSTTSMRGTVCYVAPECHGGDFLMEKTDIYSFGVLILVIVSGRRPLHVSSSPRKLEKANLISWCRQLAQAGNVLDIVDEKLKDSFNKDQAILCISLALLCLQRMPDLRPDTGDVVKILKGEMELPTVPCEFSPSPPGKHSAKSRRKPKADAD